MKISILTAIWKRPRLTELFLKYWEAQDVDELLCVASPEDDTLTDRRWRRWGFVHHHNQSLADKWLHGMRELKGADAVLIAGSDDFITPDYIDHCRDLLNEGAELIVPRYIHYYDARKKRLMRVRHKRPGAGRVITAGLLERVSWQPWCSGDRNVDGSMEKRLKEVLGADEAERVYTYIEEPVGVILDVKIGQNVWTYDHLRHKEYVDLDAREFLPEYFPTIAEELLTW